MPAVCRRDRWFQFALKYYAASLIVLFKTLKPKNEPQTLNRMHACRVQEGPLVPVCP